MRYGPNYVPDPQTRAELERIAHAIAQPQVGVVLYEVQQTPPPRLQAGMVCYFAAGIVGADEGLYEYTAGAWVYLSRGAPPTTAVTPPVDDNTTKIATTAYVIGQASAVAPAAPGAAAVGASLRYARADHVHPLQVNVAGSSGSCTGNAASATTAAACSGNAASATTAAACSGNAATATTSGACSGNAATATTAAACSGNAATATTSTTQAADDNSTKIATTAYVIGQASAVVPLLAAGAGAIGASLRYARADHVHPASLMPGPAFESAQQNIPAANVQLVVAHGLGRVPKMFRAVMRITVAISGFAVGDEVDITSINDGVRGTYQTWVDAVNCGWIAANVSINVLARPSGGIVGIGTANAKIVFYAW